jgi:hypothetical protein
MTQVRTKTITESGEGHLTPSWECWPGGGLPGGRGF